jgi:outer membrane immunogenic protein
MSADDPIAATPRSILLRYATARTSPPPPKYHGGGGRFTPRPSIAKVPSASTGGELALVGTYAGIGFGTLTTFGPNWTTTGVDSFDHSDFVMPDNRAWYSAGFLAAPYIGYQWTFTSRWLAAIEGEVGYATNNVTTGVPGVSSAPGDSVNVKEDWEGGVRARLGYAVLPNVVVYGTTGLAVQHIQATVTCSSATPFPCGRFGPVTAFTQTNSPTLPGWTIGAGLEYVLTRNLRLRAEYRYSDYGTYNAIYGNPANVAVSSSLRLQTNTALLGLSYAFGPPAPASLPPLVEK